VKLGATGPGSETYDVPKVLEAALGLPIQLVSGYKGTADIQLAAEGGELGGTCWGWEAMKVRWRNALASGKAIVVLQALPKAHADLAKVPLAINLAKSEAARRLIEAGVHDQSSILRPYALPPGTPKDRVKILRQAFQETMADRDFLAEAAKANLTIDPLAGEDLERIVAKLFKLDLDVVARLKEVLLSRR
jgi:hypothetical protein